MADLAKLIAGPTQPGTSNGTLYTVPALTTCIVKEFIIANTANTAKTVTIALNGTAATAANCIFGAVSIPANSTQGFPCWIPLAAAGTIQALQQTAGAITVTVSGIEKT